MQLNKIFLIIFFISASFWLWGAAQAQDPSFEIYNSNCGGGVNCTSYPTVTDISVSVVGGLATVSANVFDVSGFLAPVVIINGPLQDGTSFQMGTSDNVFYQISFDVSDPASYQPGSAYTVTILAVDVFGNSSGSNYTSSFTIAGPPARNIVSVAQISDINVANGTLFANINLPTTVQVTLDDSSTANLDVSWNQGSYDGNTAGTYALTGDIILPVDGSITNTSNLTASVNVIVAGACISATKNGATVCATISSSTNSSNITAFTVSPSNSISVGTQATLSATISGTGNGETVYFRDLDSILLLGSSTTASGTATFSYYPSFSGTHMIQVAYLGNPLKSLEPSVKTLSLSVSGNCFAKNGATVCASVNVANPNTMTSFTALPSSVSSGTAVTLTANLPSVGSGETVTFKDATGTLTIGTAVTNISGTATLTYSPSFSGTHTLQAIYLGNMLKGYAPSYKETGLTLSGNCNTKNGATTCISTNVSPTLP